jgi:glutamine amidotransferase
MLELMCRMVGYLGQALPVRTLLDDRPHSLERQSYAARELSSSVVSADGWGFSFYVPHEDEPCVYRSGLPIWADSNRLSLGRAVITGCALAAVRSATDPLSHGIHNTQPFSFGRLSFLHNGYVKPFRGRLQRALRDSLGDEAYALIRGDTDSEHYFALIVDEWLAASRAQHSHDEVHHLSGALERATTRLLELGRAHGAEVLVAAVLADGASLALLRAGCWPSGNGSQGHAAAVSDRAAGAPPTLYVTSVNGGVTVASEPLDDVSEWRPVEIGAPLLAERRGESVVMARARVA